jgi:NAD(P)-dependent dehydrogenase (short-subunit alcohol dehydrogenase family)
VTYRLGRIALIAAAWWGCTEARSEPGPSAEQRRDEQQATTRVVLVTGSTDGLGREVARRLGARGDRVIVHGRDIQRGEALVREIESSGPGSARFYRSDFGSLANVRELAARIRRDYDRLDVLVNNAGILISGNRRPVSEDGHELHFQVNYLAGVLLTRELLPLLQSSRPARIINVASRSSAPLDFNDIMLERGYSTSRAYGQSKLAQIMFTFDIAEELRESGISVNAIHPATRMDTDLVRDGGMRPRSTIDEGADAVVRLINDLEAGTGRFFDGQTEARARAQAYDSDVRARLAEVTDRLLSGGG